MKIKLFVGLPGSGKSYYMNNLDSTWEKIDDPKIGVGFPIMGTFENLAISDPNFCDANILNKACEKLKKLYYDADIEIIFFENDPVKCHKNVIRRDDGRKVDNFIDYLTKIYNPPVDSIVIYEGDN